jgi:hypothetical protein
LGLFKLLALASESYLPLSTVDAEERFYDFAVHDPIAVSIGAELSQSKSPS